MTFPRSSGLLLHITSLPGRFGIGEFGSEARKFVDFLCQSGQSIWQILPLGPTSYGDSPYSSYSAFAGNPLLIGLEDLQSRGLLSPTEVDSAVIYSGHEDQAQFGEVYAKKTPLLKVAAKRFFHDQQNCEAIDEFEAFCTKQQWWLDDFALFAALMKQYKTDDWTTWDQSLVHREPVALQNAQKNLSEEIEYEQFVQFLFYSQFHDLKSYANRKGIRIFGDMPIFVAQGSADVWANQDIFYLNKDGKQSVVAGVPPDYFSKTGQLWGNPLYNWDRLAETNYRWWTQRFRSAFELFDLMRIDHFRAFEAYWEVPAGSKTAINGRWAPGPGRAPFDAAKRALGELDIVAEDLGMITEAVHELRDELNLPGMRILQFGFDQEHDVFHRPEAYPENSVAYTGTHDNATIMGWFNDRKRQLKEDILDRYLPTATKQTDIHWSLVNMVLECRSHTAIFPVQDILGLGDTARMNVPGLADGNWAWRVRKDLLTDEVAQRLRHLTEASGRLANLVQHQDA